MYFSYESCSSALMSYSIICLLTEEIEVFVFFQSSSIPLLKVHEQKYTILSKYPTFILFLTIAILLFLKTFYPGKSMQTCFFCLNILFFKFGLWKASSVHLFQETILFFCFFFHSSYLIEIHFHNLPRTLNVHFQAFLVSDCWCYINIFNYCFYFDFT